MKLCDEASDPWIKLVHCIDRLRCKLQICFVDNTLTQGTPPTIPGSLAHLLFLQLKVQMIEAEPWRQIVALKVVTKCFQMSSLVRIVKNVVCGFRKSLMFPSVEGYCMDYLF